MKLTKPIIEGREDFRTFMMKNIEKFLEKPYFATILPLPEINKNAYKFSTDKPSDIADNIFNIVSSFDETGSLFKNDINRFMIIGIESDTIIHLIWNHAIADGMTMMKFLYNCLNMQMGFVNMPEFSIKKRKRELLSLDILKFKDFFTENLKVSLPQVAKNRSIPIFDIRSIMEKYTVDMNTAVLYNTVQHIFSNNPSINRLNTMINIAIKHDKPFNNNFSVIPIIIYKTDEPKTIYDKLQSNVKYANHLYYYGLSRSTLKIKGKFFYVDLVFSQMPESRKFSEYLDAMVLQDTSMYGHCIEDYQSYPYLIGSYNKKNEIIQTIQH